jgi:hypothetical protein
MIILQWKISLEYSYIFKNCSHYFLSISLIMDKFLVHCSQVVNPFMDKFEDKSTCYRNLKWKQICVVVGLDKENKFQIK